MSFPIAQTVRITVALVLLLGSSFAQAARGQPASWGVYAELVGTGWNAPGGYPRKAWRWSEDGQSILELEQRTAGAPLKTTTIKSAKKGGRLVEISPGGARRKGVVGSDGSVVWTSEDLAAATSRTALEGGALVEQAVKLKDGRPKKVTGETRFVRSSDLAWTNAKGKGKGKNAGGAPPASVPAHAPNVIIPPPQVASAPVPAAPAAGNDSLECMMQSAAVRAAGCKPPSASTSSTTTTAPAAGAAQVLMVDGQLVNVTRNFPPNIDGIYLYEKRGEPIIDLRTNGTGRFQAHMIAPIAINWWLKSSPTGVPEKITGRNGNYRYTVVLQYLKSTNGNYPSGSYASWYLDTDVAAGCSIILGERFKCR